MGSVIDRVKRMFGLYVPEEFDNLLPETIHSHSGLKGIAEYIRKKKPKAVLHGHLHDRYVLKADDTYIRCCYRIEVFSIDI